MEGCIYVVQPLIRAVYQRNSENIGKIPVKILYTIPVSSIRVKAERSDYVSDWINLELSYNTAVGTISLPAGNWYEFHVEALDKENNLVESCIISKVGVGEVFITCGQSNSLNFGYTLTTAKYNNTVSYDPINRTWLPCQDPQPCEPGPKVDMGDGGSIWPTVGDELSERIHMPIGFMASGWGGAALHEFKENTVKYERLKNSLINARMYGARAVLWHQGETDSILMTDFSAYKEMLLDLIKRSRVDAGFNITWVVAQAAYHPKADRMKEEMIRSAQKSVCNGKDILLGPNSDLLQDTYRIQNSAHFTYEGLISHGKLWSECLFEIINKN